MHFGRFGFLLLSSTMVLAGCPSNDDDDVLNCPLGTVRSGDMCVLAPDAGGGDVGLKDGGDVDTGIPDSGVEDTGPFDAGAEAATISATELDFGGLVIGLSAELSLTVENRTPDQVVINMGAITGAGESEYALTAGTVGMTTLAPNDSVTVTVQFTPTLASDALATISFSLCEGGCEVDVQISGRGLIEAISCQPNPLAFGFVNPGACVTRDVDCTNVSSYDATIFDAVLAGNSSPTLQMTASSSTPVTLMGNEALTLTVEYCPTDFTNDSGTIAVSIDHPDPAFTNQAIPITGTGGGPDINCDTTVDFGISGIGSSVTRTAACTNDGNIPLQISAAAFDAGTTPELTAVVTVGGAPANFPLSLGSGETLDIELTFAPTAAAAHTATFRVSSNDTDTPESLITVTAEALMANGCTVTVAPTNIDFGAVSPGASTEAVTTVTNTGTNNCAVNVIGLTSSSAPDFSLVNGAQSANVAPGDSFQVRVRFSPTAEVVSVGEVELSTTDVANAQPRVQLTGQGLAPFATVRAIPTAINFGQVQAGCTNPAEQTFSLQNNGAAAVDVNITMEAGSAAAFTLITPVPNPVTIQPGGIFDSTISFAPGAAGLYAGRIQVQVVGGPTLYISVDGEGNAVAATTLTFPAQPAPQLDVLVVVDDSCSMTEEQQRLAAAGSVLTARGDAAGVEYQIGVTTTDATQGISGTLRGNPTVVDWQSPTRDADLSANIQQGVTGSGIEQGLEAANEAITNTTLLQGPNAGFLRPNAELVLIFISDEPDQSPQTVGFYLNSLTNRPTGAPGTPRIYTITGGLQGCNAPGTNAAPGPRYVAAANQTGGFDRSICAQDYVPIMTEIADQTFAPARSRYQLGAAPNPGSIVVRVDGTVVPGADYGVDYVTNEVVFLAGNEPLLTQAVEIDYETQCVPGTCGNGNTDPGEQCDDMNADNTDACLDTCYSAFCGDTFILANTEQCDDGNTISGDGCNSQCTIEGCGNAIIEPPEECDDGAAQNSDVTPDACRTNCLNPFCGDNVTDTGEACDDGNADNTDACVACAVAICGDGFIQAGVEECDDANQNNNDACDNNCQSNLITYAVTTAAQTPLTPAAGTAINATDESSISVPIGFAFDYLGVPQTDVIVGSNGFIAFEPVPGNTFTNVAIPAVGIPNAMIAMWWDDHDPGRNLVPAPEVRTAVTGTAPNRVMTITYIAIPRFAAGTGRFTLEARLYETTNVIEVHYGAIEDPNNDTTWGATVGWEAQGGVRGVNVLACSPGCTEADWPTDTLYTYTPN